MSEWTIILIYFDSVTNKYRRRFIFILSDDMEETRFRYTRIYLQRNINSIAVKHILLKRCKLSNCSKLIIKQIFNLCITKILQRTRELYNKNTIDICYNSVNKKKQFMYVV